MIFKAILFVAIGVVALANGQSNFDLENNQIDNYYMPEQLDQQPGAYYIPQGMPHYRSRRQSVFGGITPSNGGTTGTLGASGTLYNQGGHRVDGHGQVSRTYNPTGPTSVGAGLDYQGPRGGASVNANHVRHFGTDVGVTGNANVWRSKDGHSSVDANANYNRHFGGPSGTGRPNYGVGGVFTHRF